MAHALTPSQQTAEAADALAQASADEDMLFVSPVILVEFHSTLRRLVRRGILTDLDAVGIVAILRRVRWTTEWVHGAAERGFELAVQLNQSDTFDTTGYAVAEALGAEFWVSDRRFAQAAAQANLPNVRVVA